MKPCARHVYSSSSPLGSLVVARIGRRTTAALIITPRTRSDRLLLLLACFVPCVFSCHCITIQLQSPSSEGLLEHACRIFMKPYTTTGTVVQFLCGMSSHDVCCRGSAQKVNKCSTRELSQIISRPVFSHCESHHKSHQAAGSDVPSSV